MLNAFSRTELLLGSDGMEALRRARVAVFGIGGVGGYAVEALARSGVGTFDLIDSDTVSLTNLTRQIIATTRTIGQYKVDAAKERILEINPDAVVNTHKVFYTPDTAHTFDFAQFDYIIDAIDSVTGKLELAVQAKHAGTPIISSMGAGNKMDPTAFRVSDITETSVCPLARVMRKELKKRGIQHLKVVYSAEKPLTPNADAATIQEQERMQRESEALSAADSTDETAPVPAKKRALPGSNAFVPSVVGLIIAGEVIRELSGFSS